MIFLIYLASGLILFLLAVIILRENPANRLNRVVALMLTFAGIAPFSTAIYQTVLSGVSGLPPWFINTFYVWELFFPVLLYFSAIFPEPRPIYYSHKRLLQLAVMPHLLHLLLVLLLADPDKVIGLLTFRSDIPIWGQILQMISSFLRIVTAFLGFLLLFHTRFFSLVNLIYVVTAIYLLQASYRRIENPRLKQQVRVVLSGILAAMALYAIGFIIPDILSLRVPTGMRDALVVACLIVGPGSIAWAIVRYQFLDVGLIARRSLVYSITTAIVVGGYLLIMFQLSSALQNILGQDSQVLNVLAIIVLLLFFQPIYSQVDDFVRRIFMRTRADYSHLIESFSREILTIFQTDKLAATISDTLRREMFIENAQVAFSDSADNFQIAYPDRETVAYQLEPAIREYLLARRAPSFCEEFSSRTVKAHLGAEIASAGIQLVVPLIRQGRLSGLLLLSSKVAGFRYTSEDLSFLTILCNQIVVAMENAELYSEALEKQRLEEELSVAKQIQTGLLPRSLPRSRHFGFATFIEPSRQVGGDFYDFIPISDNRMGLVIADASGKGVPAALLIARMQAFLQSEARLNKQAHQIMTSINRLISETIASDRFATCFYGELDEARRKLYFCNAGHNYPVLVRADGKIELLIKGGLLLGAFSNAVYESGEVDLLPGDVLVMYTDGLTEMMDATEKEFGEQRLIHCASASRHLPPHAICDNIIKSVQQFSAGPNEVDDMTLVVIKAHEHGEFNGQV